MVELEFETKPIKPQGKMVGYRLVPKVQETWQDETVYAEIIQQSGVNMSPAMLKGLFEMVISVTSDLVAKDGRPRRIGNLKFVPTIKGVVESPYSSFDEATCKAMVRPSVMKGWEKKIDSKEVDIVNTKVGNRVKLLPKLGTVGEREWGRGDNLLLGGKNVQLIEGDSVTITWLEGEEEKSAALEVVSTKSFLTEVKWPKELDGVAAGTRIDLVWRSRGGIEDGVWQTRYRKLTLVEKA